MLVAVEAAARHWTIATEDSRKVVHVGSALVAASLPVFMAFGSVVVLSVGFIAFMAVSRRFGLFPAVHDVERSTLGELYFPLGVALTAALFPYRLPYAYGLLVMGVSDAAASFVGQRYASRGYRLLTASKTYLGSGVFCATTVVISVVAVSFAGGSPPTAFLLGTVLACILTVVEGASGGGIDNAVLPVVAAATLVWVT